MVIILLIFNQPYLLLSAYSLPAHYLQAAFLLLHYVLELPLYLQFPPDYLHREYADSRRYGWLKIRRIITMTNKTILREIHRENKSIV